MLAHPRSILAVAASAPDCRRRSTGRNPSSTTTKAWRRDVLDARALGLRSKLCVHLRQVPVVHDVLRPSEHNVHQTLRRWWTAIGRPSYPDARRLLVCADVGGSNGYRVRLWKLELRRLAD